MKFTRIGAVVTMLVFLCATMVVAAQQSTDEQGMSSRVHRASQMIGAEVENSQGEELGKIEDIVIDPADNRVAYAVLSFGGFLGLGEKYFAIPWNALQHRGEDKDTVVLNVDKERLENAPGFNKNDWPDMANRSWGKEIHAYYGQQPYWVSGEGLRQEAKQHLTSPSTPATGDSQQQTMAQDAGQSSHNAVSATIETIDPDRRQLTLMMANGNTVEFKAPEALLKDLQTGDSVEVTIHKKGEQQSQQMDKKQSNN
jgi:sporulation protein YlmC with PRC-barrel domain